MQGFFGGYELGDLLSQTFHDISLHGSVFHACAVITQLMINNGEPLFDVEYNYNIIIIIIPIIPLL